METLRSYADLAAWTTRPVYLAVGFFDGVHLGHQHLLAQLRDAAAKADAASLALTFSNSPKRYHQPQLSGHDWRYLTTAGEKLALLADCGVDATLLLEYDESVASQTGEEFLRGIMETTPLAGICAGFDSSIGNDMVHGREQFAALCARIGIALVWVEPFLLDGAPVKSSRIREMVGEAQLGDAARLLGRNYFLCGEVVHGKGVGAPLLGIPTANVSVPHEKFIPPPGIYAGVAQVGAARYPAAVCLSSEQQHRRTVLDRSTDVARAIGADPEGYVVESHLIGFSGELYDQQLRVELIERIRPWEDFASAEALAAKMREDIAMVQCIVGDPR